MITVLLSQIGVVVKYTPIIVIEYINKRPYNACGGYLRL